ncbi:MAG: D-aminoacylase [Nitrospirae bacterium]|nr:D-aminoacylase [Nitrospirota bacterium]
MSFDFLIKGGLVIDGLRANSEPKEIDIGIEGDRIRAIGDFSEESAKKVIDARGVCVCPGFIDAHAHSEFTLLADGRAHGKICQGVTTEINGNCGLSAAPLYGEALQQREGDLEELHINERWNSLQEYFTLLNKKGFAANFATLVGHGNLRASVMGYAAREPSEVEMKKMAELLRTAMQSGAKGLSTGLIYPPGVYSTTEEINGLAKEAALHNGLYTSHLRSEGDNLLEAIEEAVKIGFKSDIDVHISHLKTSGRRNWSKIKDAFKKIDEARLIGLNISCDRYPYIAGSTDLDAVLPAWTYEGGHSKELERLKDPEVRERIRKEIQQASEGQNGGDYWDSIMISSLNVEKNKWMEGKKISDIGKAVGRLPIELLFDILIEEDLRVSAIFFSMSEDNLREILKQPYTMIGSDSSARCFDGITAKGKPHPRGFGSFPRVLGRYFGEEKILSVTEAVYKMTGLPAKTFRIKERGVIATGFFADIIIFDHDRIKDRASFDNPFRKPDGIYYVFVNGVPALWEGEFTQELPGRILT